MFSELRWCSAHDAHRLLPGSGSLEQDLQKPRAFCWLLLDWLRTRALVFAVACARLLWLSFDVLGVEAVGLIWDRRAAFLVIDRARRRFRGLLAGALG